MLSARPVPAYAPDTILTDLSTPELLLVGTLRLFAARPTDRARYGTDWSSGLRAAGLGARGVPAFRSLLELIMVSASRPLRVRRLCCLGLSRDEAGLLQVIGLLQRQRHADAAALLAAWLPPAAVRLAMSPSQALAAAMAQVRLIIPLRRADAANAAHFYPDRGLALIQ